MTDAINALFQLAAGGFVMLNVRQVLVRRAVSGQALPTVLFFVAWGAWNLWYFTQLDQPLSAVGAAGALVANALLLVAILVYRRTP